MGARFPHVRTCFLGQSQCVHFLTGSGGGEIREEAFPNRPALDYYRENLALLMPGVARSDGYSAVGGTACFRQYATGSGFWNIGAGADTHGTAAAAVMTSGAVAGGLAVYVHYSHGEDVAHASFASATVAAGMTAFYTWLHAQAIGAGWGEVRILPVLACTWTSIQEGGEALTNFRRIQRSLAGEDNFPGAGRLPFVLRPVENTSGSVFAAIADTGQPGAGDYLHVTKAYAVGNAHALAMRVAAHNGFAVPTPDQPRLFRAIRTGAASCDAYVTTPGGAPLLLQHPTFALMGVGNLTFAGVDNSRCGSHRYARVSLTHSGPIAPGSRVTYGRGSRAAYYGTPVPPRGLCGANWETPLTAITDAREDCAGQMPAGFAPSLPMAHTDRGVAIEEP